MSKEPGAGKPSGLRARARRVELGLTQREVGVALGLDPASAQSTVSQLETGGISSLEMAERLAFVLWCEPAWLAFAAPPKAKKE